MGGFVRLGLLIYFKPLRWTALKDQVHFEI